MPYGIILDSTREYITKRARESNIDLEKLGLEPDIPGEGSWSVDESGEVHSFEIEGIGEATVQMEVAGNPLTHTGRWQYDAFRYRDLPGRLEGVIGSLETAKVLCEEYVSALPDNLYQISVIFGGALDEEFYVQTDYEVNIADWMAEQTHDEANKQGGETWEIIVSEFAWEGGGSVRYRVSDETYSV